MAQVLSYLILTYIDLQEILMKSILPWMNKEILIQRKNIAFFIS